jgi:membrane dipeptidase
LPITADQETAGFEGCTSAPELAISASWYGTAGVDTVGARRADWLRVRIGVDVSDLALSAHAVKEVKMIIFDSHLDLGWNAVSYNRDLTKSIAEIRKSETGSKEKGRGTNTVCFPEMRKGEVALCLATVFARATSLGEPMADYRTQEIAYAVAQAHRAYYRVMESEGQVRMIKDWPSLEGHLKNSEGPRNGSAPLGFILSMEGADPVVSPSRVAEWWGDGLRVVGPGHYGLNAYAHGTASLGGLTPKGRELLREMDAVHMILDASC